jgi:predicted PurR-regulated permease PerM
MEVKNYNSLFFFLILAVISILAFFLIKPFFIAIFLASVLAVIFRKPYVFFLKITRGSAPISALLVSIGGVLILLFLVSVISTLVVNEATSFYRNLSLGNDPYQQISQNITEAMRNNPIIKSIGGEALINKELINKVTSQGSNLLLGLIQGIYASFANLILLIFVAFFSLYYFLIDGKNLVARLMYLSPLKNSHEKLLIEKFISISRATIKGALVISFIQGFIAGVAFVIAGVPSAAIWSILVMFFSLVPLVGSGLIWLPIAIILLFEGAIWQGLFILFVGFGIISVIDNFLRPKLVGKDTEMHPLVVLFATLGGISMFGFFGFIIGPIVMALFLTLWDIYSIEFKKQLKKYNA